MTRNNRGLLAFLGFVIVFLLTIQIGSAQQKGQGMLKWEYKVMTPGNWISDSDVESTDILNRLGESGWEIVLTVPASNTRELKVVLKRQKQ